MSYRDLLEARNCAVALRELVTRPAAWPSGLESRAAAERICRAAIAVLDDAECHRLLRGIEAQLLRLLSGGADHRRDQILISLEALNTRLLTLQTEAA